MLPVRSRIKGFYTGRDYELIKPNFGFHENTINKSIWRIKMPQFIEGESQAFEAIVFSSTKFNKKPNSLYRNVFLWENQIEMVSEFLA